MNYYERKIKAQNLVKRHLNENPSTLFPDLLILIVERTGMGKKFLMDYLNNLIDVDFITIDGELGSATCLIKTEVK